MLRYCGVAVLGRVASSLHHSITPDSRHGTLHHCGSLRHSIAPLLALNAENLGGATEAELAGSYFVSCFGEDG